MVCAVSAKSATLKTIHTGVATINAQNVTVVIPAVNTATSFLVFTTSCSSNRPGKFQVGGTIATPTTLFFRRHDGGGPNITINWQVFEFASGVSVQRGLYSGLPAAGANITIGAVDLSKSFVLTTMRKDGSTYGSDDGITADLTSPTNLYIDRQPGGANPQGIYWQVIEYDSCVVQKATGTLAAGSETTSFTWPLGVNEYKTMIVGSHQISGNVSVADLPSAELDNDKTMSLNRANTNASMDYVYYAVEFTDSTKVIHGAIRHLISENDVSTTIPAVNVATSGIIAPGNFNRVATNCQVTDDHVGYSWMNLSLTSATTVRAQRPSTGFAALVPFQVIDFSNAASVPYTRPEPGASTPRGSGLCIAALPIELAEFTAKEADADVVLSWTTLTETNNNYFTVEHSIDGVEFDEIGIVAGAVNSTEVINYEFVHENPFAGENYYRLKQTDMNGSFSNSEIVAVDLGQVSDASIQVVPNPNNGVFRILFSEDISTAQRAYLQITDLAGTVVYSESLNGTDAMSITLDADGQSLQNGVYIASVVTKGATTSEKIIIR